MNPNNRQVYTCISSADVMYITYSIHSGFFLGMEGWGFEGLWERGGVWICFLVKFSLKPNPNCLLPSVHSFFFFFPKTEVKRNVQKFHVLTGKKRLNENSYLKENGFVHLYLCIWWKSFVSYLSHSQRMVAVSLHLSFLAVLLHFLLQFFLLLRRPVLLFTSLPASLSV